MGGIVKTLRRSNSPSRSLFSTAGSFGQNFPELPWDLPRSPPIPLGSLTSSHDSQKVPLTAVQCCPESEGPSPDSLSPAIRDSSCAMQAEWPLSGEDLKLVILQVLRAKIGTSQGVENRGSLTNVPYALKDFREHR